MRLITAGETIFIYGVFIGFVMGAIMGVFFS